MALDHYISQVHLKNFYSFNNNPPLYAINKKSLNKFRCHAKDVCRTDEGNTNQYLTEPREIENFLKEIEKDYNSAIETLSMGKLCHQTIYVIAGWIAYVSTCSPVAIRLKINFLKEIHKEKTRILDKQGELSLSPELLKMMKANSIMEAIESGMINIEIDPKYPQAISISSVRDIMYIIGNSKWEILMNPPELKNPFFTSDYPIALEKTFPNQIIIIPLTPCLALRVYLNTMKIKDESFFGNKCVKIKIDRKKSEKINTLIVRCAEELVFYNENFPRIEKFVKRNKDYCMEEVTSRIGTGTFIVSKKICKKQ